MGGNGITKHFFLIGESQGNDDINKIISYKKGKRHHRKYLSI